MEEPQVPSLCGDGPLEENMATCSSSRILAWIVPWAEEPGRLQSMGSFGQTQLRTHRASLIRTCSFFFFFDCAAPNQGMESEILTTGLPGNSVERVFHWKN